jgi:serine protease AprX
VPAPILPGTPTAVQAELLAELEDASDAVLRDVIAAHPGVDADLDAAVRADVALVRQLVALKIRNENVISGAYKHVDGTSFAAPIVSSVAAQMLEANPGLSPRECKRLLIATARRIAGVEPDRQGWGAVDASRAVAAAEQARSRTAAGKY